MRNYEHDRLNSRTSMYISKRVRNSILKNLELEGTPPLKNTPFIEIMQNYGHERLDSRISMTI
ncbi:hypothetical protein MTR67_052481 [Solanum verrucosum]|uniref:Uncharacterized protein n=1 Tax=Solanum verrucosum TaxID=315347 RepID=A0AAF0V9D3_SOLVR|nr:hypothetical protein MTR67_052481 [Solanum verrucosum]